MRNTNIFIYLIFISCFSSCFLQRGNAQSKKEINISLIKGKWTSVNDSSISIRFFENEYVEYLNNEELFKTKYFLVDSCLTSLPKIISNKGEKIIYEDKGDIICISIKYLSKNQLSLLFENFGKLVSYKKSF